MLHVQKWQRSWLWVLTHFQVFHSHSIQDCNTEEKQDSVTHNIYSQQGGARSTAGLAVGCGKKTREEKLQHKMRRPGCTNRPSPSQVTHAATPRPLHLIHTHSTLPKPYGIHSFTRLSKCQSQVAPPSPALKAGGVPTFPSCRASLRLAAAINRGHRSSKQHTKHITGISKQSPLDPLHLTGIN